MKKNNSGVVILAGGNSSRMNYPKPFLYFRDGKSFLYAIAETYWLAGITKIFVVLNKEYCSDKWKGFLEPAKSMITIIENSNPDAGRLFSLKLGVEEMKDIDFCFVQNADNPFVSASIISLLWENRMNDAYVSPLYNGKGGHPVLLSKKILNKVLLTSSNEITLKELLNQFDKTEVETNDEKILWNVNTIQDYQDYLNAIYIKGS